MSKNKLSKFADMAAYPHVFEPPATSLSECEQHIFPLRGRWHEDYFHNDRPIVLELGCGRGEYTVGLGKLFPEKNFIGIDIKGARMWHGATTSLRDGMTNVAFVRTRIEFVDLFFAENEVDEIWLTFSDPQMKKVTKRLTSTFFLNRYRKFLTDGGKIHVKTDSNFLFTYTRLMVQKNHLPIDLCTEDLYHDFTPHAGEELQRVLGIQTYYESQWLSRGLNIKYICFSLPKEGQLEEPNVEIELDDYRSYNRAKRSGLEKSV